MMDVLIIDDVQFFSGRKTRDVFFPPATSTRQQIIDQTNAC